MSARFTPGPWFVEEMDTRKRQYRVRCTLGQANGGCGMEVVKGIELDHDARLIAAAPDLYAVAEAVTKIGAVAAAHGLGLLIRQAHSALAKARGEP